MTGYWFEELGHICPCGFDGPIEAEATIRTSTDEWELTATTECPECGRSLEWHTSAPHVYAEEPTNK